MICGTRAAAPRCAPRAEPRVTHAGASTSAARVRSPSGAKELFSFTYLSRVKILWLANRCNVFGAVSIFKAIILIVTL